MSQTHDQQTLDRRPSREQIDAAHAKAESICDLPHVAGAGCIKCTGLVTAELAGRLTSPVVREERSAASLGPKNTEDDTCGACENGVAQHDVLRYHEGAQAPSPSVTEAALKAEYPKNSHDGAGAEPGKERPYYGTEWAGKTAPDGTQVPRLEVCDFGYGHNEAPNASASKMASLQKE